MTHAYPTAPIDSFPHVSDRARYHWQIHVARMTSASMPGIGLDFVVRRLRERRFARLSQLHAIIVRRTDSAVLVTGLQGRRVPYGVSFSNVRFEVDLLRGPGVASPRMFPHGHHELILGTAVRTANTLIARPQRWADRSCFDLPALYADFGTESIPDPDGPELETACLRSGLTPRMVMARDTIVHKSRRLIPLAYVGHTERSFDVFVDMESVPRRQPCGAATLESLQFCEGAIEFDAIGRVDENPQSTEANTLAIAA